MTSKSQGVWVLAHAYKYEQSRRGRIKGSTQYDFVWDVTASKFVLSAGAELKELPMPVELAEAFFLQCLDQGFRQRVIVDSSQTVQERVEVGGLRLCLRRCQERYSCKSDRLPGLSLTVESDGATLGYLFLPYQVRMDLGSTMARTMPEEIHAMLHPPVAA